MTNEQRMTLRRNTLDEKRRIELQKKFKKTGNKMILLQAMREGIDVDYTPNDDQYMDYDIMSENRRTI